MSTYLGPYVAVLLLIIGGLLVLLGFMWLERRRAQRELRQLTLRREHWRNTYLEGAQRLMIDGVGPGRITDGGEPGRIMNDSFSEQIIPKSDPMTISRRTVHRVPRPTPHPSADD